MQQFYPSFFDADELVNLSRLAVEEGGDFALCRGVEVSKFQLVVEQPVLIVVVQTHLNNEFKFTKLVLQLQVVDVLE